MSGSANDIHIDDLKAPVLTPMQKMVLDGFAGVDVVFTPGAVLEEHEENFNELSFVIKGDATIEGKECPEGSYFYTPAGNKHGPFTTREGCQFLIVKFSP